MKTSVASVTFRAKSIKEIINIARKANLHAIEWGGDIHVPPKNAAAARQAFAYCKENGLEISAYGSYYRADKEQEFEYILETALRLESRVIRVWAGKKPSIENDREEVVEHLMRAVSLAEEEGCIVATEYHAQTLTDTLKSTLQLLNEVPKLRTLWQPPIGASFNDNILAINSLSGKIENLHVYHRASNGTCLALNEGEASWRRYLIEPHGCSENSYATLEFVKKGTDDQFLQDAKTLHRIIKEKK